MFSVQQSAVWFLHTVLVGCDCWWGVIVGGCSSRILPRFGRFPNEPRWVACAAMLALSCVYRPLLGSRDASGAAVGPELCVRCFSRSQAVSISQSSSQSYEHQLELRVSTAGVPGAAEDESHWSSDMHEVSCQVS